MAIAAYLRTLRSGDSRWDRFMAGDMTALNAQEQAGWKLFSGKAQCHVCHTPPLFANGNYHDLGLERGKLRPDAGRGTVTGEARDMYAFRTPTLRSVSRSAPYFHDGSAATLEAAVRVMASGSQSQDAPSSDRRQRSDAGRTRGGRSVVPEDQPHRRGGGATGGLPVALDPIN